MRLDEIVARLGGELVGDGATEINRVGTLATAGTGQISFLANPKYRSQLVDTRAAAVIVPPALVGVTARPCILHPQSYTYYARVAQLLYPRAVPAVPVHPSVQMGEGVVLGEGVVIHAGCVLGDGVEIGAGSVLFPNVSIYAGCVVGQRAIIHSGAVVGADGFGFAKDGEAWLKIPQVGRVVIGDDVEIGANTTIDRGAIDDTVIGNGVKLDNQIQVGHNVTIGEHTAMAGCVGIAGSAHIGCRCTVGGGAIILGHLTLGDDVHVSAGTMVTKSLSKPGQYTGVFPVEDHEAWLKNAAHLRHLTRMAKRMDELEKKLEQLEKKS